MPFLFRHCRVHRKQTGSSAPALDDHHPHLGGLRHHLRRRGPRQRLDHPGHPQEQVHAHPDQRLPRQPRHLRPAHAPCR